MADLSEYLKYGDALIEQVGATESLAPTLKRVILNYTGGVGRKVRSLITTSAHLTSEYATFKSTHKDAIASFVASPLPVGDNLMPVPKGMAGSYRATVEGLIDGFNVLDLPSTLSQILTILDHLEKDLKSNTSSSNLIIKYTSELENLKKMSYVCEEVIAAQRKLFSNAYSHPRPMKSVIATKQDFAACMSCFDQLTQLDHLGKFKSQIAQIEGVAERIVTELETREHYRKTVASLIQKVYTLMISVTDAYAVVLHNTSLTTHAFVVGMTAALRA